jgi:hypothetical protein
MAPPRRSSLEWSAMVTTRLASRESPGTTTNTARPCAKSPGSEWSRSLRQPRSRWVGRTTGLRSMPPVGRPSRALLEKLPVGGNARSAAPLAPRRTAVDPPRLTATARCTTRESSGRPGGAVVARTRFRTGRERHDPRRRADRRPGSIHHHDPAGPERCDAAPALVLAPGAGPYEASPHDRGVGLVDHGGGCWSDLESAALPDGRSEQP